MIPFKDNIPNDRAPVMTLGLILVNVVVYVIACVHGGSLWSGPDAAEMARWGALPDALTVKTMLTGLVIGGSLVQVAGNMLFLWIFGNTVEDAMGPIRYLGFYVVGGLLALALQVAIAPHAGTPVLGAAGAIAAVIGGYIALYRRSRILTLVLIPLLWGVMEVPAPVMVILWLAMQAAFGTGTAAYLGHLGGLVLGALAIRLLATHRKPTPPTAAAYR